MGEPGPGEWMKDACLLLLQLVTGLKQLQARGVEETSLELAVVARDGRDPHPRLILVPPPPDACECVDEWMRGRSQRRDGVSLEGKESGRKGGKDGM